MRGSDIDDVVVTGTANGIGWTNRETDQINRTACLVSSVDRYSWPGVCQCDCPQLICNECDCAKYMFSNGWMSGRADLLLIKDVNVHVKYLYDEKAI